MYLFDNDLWGLCEHSYDDMITLLSQKTNVIVLILFNIHPVVLFTETTA